MKSAPKTTVDPNAPKDSYAKAIKVIFRPSRLTSMFGSWQFKLGNQEIQFQFQMSTISNNCIGRARNQQS